MPLTSSTNGIQVLSACQLKALRPSPVKVQGKANRLELILLSNSVDLLRRLNNYVDNPEATKDISLLVQTFTIDLGTNPDRIEETLRDLSDPNSPIAFAFIR
jgi:hypothetical protein